MPRTEEQYEEIRRVKKLIIMNAALEEFAEHGYHASTVSNITKRAGVSKGLLYNYFSSKESLLKEIVKKAYEEVWDNFDPNRDGFLTNDEFFYFIKQNFKVIRENISFWKLYSAILLQPKVLEIIENDFEGKETAHVQMLYDFFKRNKCESPEEEMMIFAALLKGVSMMFIGNPVSIDIDKYEKTIINFYKKKFNNN